MHMLTEDRNRQSDDRLRMKTQDDTLMRAAMDGAGLTPWEARALPELVDEMYFPSRATLIRCVMGSCCINAPLLKRAQANHSRTATRCRFV